MGSTTARLAENTDSLGEDDGVYANPVQSSYVQSSGPDSSYGSDNLTPLQATTPCVIKVRMLNCLTDIRGCHMLICS